MKGVPLCIEGNIKKECEFNYKVVKHWVAPAQQNTQLKRTNLFSLKGLQLSFQLNRRLLRYHVHRQSSFGQPSRVFFQSFHQQMKPSLSASTLFRVLPSLLFLLTRVTLTSTVQYPRTDQPQPHIRPHLQTQCLTI